MGTASIDGLIAELSEHLDEVPFSGVVIVHYQGRTVFEHASGLAERSAQRPMTIGTRLGTASCTKGFTALTAVSMIEEGLFDFDTRLVDLIRGDLPAVDQSVTIEHLLGHTSGAGDYLDEEVIESADSYVLDVPIHTLLGPEDYVPLLNRQPQVEPSGERFRYNNSGYVILALAIERAGQRSYHDEVRHRVFRPAGMDATDFLRSDQLPAGTALGYLTDGRTNVLHLPVIGTGDGGVYSTAPDMMLFWEALFAGRIVAPEMVTRMTTVRGEYFADAGRADTCYGLGFWIDPGRTSVALVGQDAGVSLRSGADPTTGLRFCLIANNSTDVWPLARVLRRWLPDLA